MKRRDFRKLSPQERRQLIREEVTSKTLYRSFELDIRELEIDEKARTVRNVSFSSETPVETWWGTEILSHDRKAVMLERLNSGGALLSDHNSRAQVGVVVPGSASIGSDRKLRGDWKFSQRQTAEDEFQDVISGIRTNVSIGYWIHEYTYNEKTETLTATRWEVLEVSLVAIPADTAVGVGRSADVDTKTPIQKKTRRAAEDADDPDEESDEYSDEEDEEPARKVQPIKKRKTMALKRKNKPAAEELDELEDDEQPEREIETAPAEDEHTARVRQFRTFAENVATSEDEKKRFARIASDLALEEKDLPALRVALIAERKKKQEDTTPPPQDPAARDQNVIQFPYASKPRNFKGQTTQEAARKAYRFGMWFRAALEGNEKAQQWCQENGVIIKRAQQEGINEKGGFLVPAEFGNDMIDLREEFGVVRRLFKVVPMTSDTRSDPRRTGGLTAFFVGESDPGTQSDKTWDRVSLTARKLMCLTRLSSEIQEDSVVSLGDDLAGEIAYAFANKEDDCGINGDGTSTFGGITGLRQAFKNLSGTIANIAGLAVATGTGYATSYNSIVLKDFHKVKARLPQYALRRGPSWLFHQSFWSEVVEPLVLAVGGVTAMEIAAGAPPRLLGYPVEISQVMPSVSAVNQVCAFFGVYYLAASFGDRRQTTLALSEHSRFANDEVEIRGTERFDEVIHDVGNADATAANRKPGPVVGLITAAS